MLSRFSSVQLFVTLWTTACQVSLSMGFPRQEYWSGLSFPSSGDLPNPGIETASLMSPALAGGSFTTSTTWEAAPKNWCFWTVVLEKTLESALDCQERNQPWIFIGRTDTEVEAPILWPSDAKRRLVGKDPDAGKDWGQEEKKASEYEMFGWHHCLNGHEFEQTPGDSEGQGSLACCSPWDHKELDMT